MSTAQDQDRENSETMREASEEKQLDNDEETLKIPRPVRLFVGQVPETMVERHITNLFAAEGINLMDVAIIRDRHTGRHRHCAFVTVPSRECADAAIETFHDKQFLEPMLNPMQVRDANQPKSKAAYEAMRAYSRSFGTPMPSFARKPTSTKSARRSNSNPIAASFSQMHQMNPLISANYMQYMQMQPMSPYPLGYPGTPYVYGYYPAANASSPMITSFVAPCYQIK